ncbi:EAL-associated domain-containing protein [Lysinibacillus sp. KU-BSD001]|uniref:EAL-associated domain-containing protein n=1 Tax=Lysinibacillus sp. KU-BSD001 TaxID=3141328 RepID=UPI0036E15A40
MDMLEVLDKLDQIEILYEPIYSADEHSIVAYEVIGRIVDKEKVIDIEKFTYSDEVPEEIRAEVEQMVVRQAIESALHEIDQIDLYIPCNPNLLMTDFGESYFSLLKELIPEHKLHHITLTMNEHLFKGDIRHVHHVIKYIKTYGVKIGLANIGAHSQLNAILMLEPSVLSINVSELNYNKWGSQNYVFTTLRTLALKMGASLMVNDIDNIYQLQHGWKNGARYYKGAYLQKPASSFIPRDTLKPRFRDECEQFIATEKKLLKHKLEELKKLEKKITSSVEQIGPTSDHVEKLKELAQQLQEYTFRLYICNGEGFQTTPNITWKHNQWMLEEEALGKNWSWRPYFLQNLLKMRQDQVANLSSAYSDIETGELTRTFSMALPNNQYLFIDISYNYLYEHNIVN